MNALDFTAQSIEWAVWFLMRGFACLGVGVNIVFILLGIAVAAGFFLLRDSDVLRYRIALSLYKAPS